MNFRLRQVEYTVDGRRIARDRLVDGDALTIGRAAENDIHLADLAVDPYHGVIESVGGTRLRIRSLGTLGFAIDGRHTAQVTVDAAAGAELRFGVTAITVSLDSTSAVLLEIESRTRQAKPDPAIDKAGFSLAAIMPGKRGIGWGLLTAILLLFLALPIASHLSRAGTGNGHIPGDIAGQRAWNPGELSLAHHNLSSHCEACHVRPFQAVRNETCLSCHRQVHEHAPADRLAMARGSPGPGTAALQHIGHAFGREAPGACTDCHVEHQGMRAMEAPRQQFCADCHAGLKGRLGDTALGDAADFGTLHPQFRAWVVADAETRRRVSISLDEHPRQDIGLTFSHATHLDAAGGVAKMALTLGAKGYGHTLGCADCHQPSSDGTGFAPVSMERNCEACHSLAYARVGGTVLTLRHGDIPQMLAQLSMAGPTAPMGTGRARPGDFAPSAHSGGLYHASFTGSGVAARAMAPSGICGQCHTPEMRGGRLAVRPVTQVTRFMPNGWFDHAAHRQTPCADCHAAAASRSSSDVILPRLAECRNCHAGEAAARPKVPSSCAMCHAYHKTALAPAYARIVRRRED